MIGKEFRKISLQKFFDKPFIKPAKGEISSQFGKIRTYNNGSTSMHAGVDVANAVGTRVVASNAGTVLMAKFLKVHGGTVMIDHGYGVVTIYNHLDKISVKKGQVLQMGRTIGRMGMTGVATGPHVHWGMSVQNVRVNPLFFTSDDLFKRNAQIRLEGEVN